MRARLRRLMHRLTEAVGRDAIIAAGETIALDPESRSTAAISLRSPKRACTRATGNTLRRAADLHDAPFLDGFELPQRQASPTGCWRGARSSNGCRRACCASSQRSARRVAIPTPRSPQPHVCSRSTRSASRARLLMRLHAQGGRAERLEQTFRQCVQVLGDELGVAPSRETQSEYARLRGALTAPQIVSAGDPLRRRRGRQRRLLDLRQRPATGAGAGIRGPYRDGVGGAAFGRFPQAARRDLQVIIFDRRGLGLSERLGVRPSIDSAVSDIRAILDHAASRTPSSSALRKAGRSRCGSPPSRRSASRA